MAVPAAGWFGESSTAEMRMPRFVLLHHKTPPGAAKPDHFDLMLESGAILKTWTVWEFPHLDRPNRAMADLDHRLAYLDYEGPISGNRGEVSRADWGTYTLLQQEEERVTIELQGECLQGKLVLEIHSGSDSVEPA